MKKIIPMGIVFCIAGAVMLILPIHMQMTGVVLLLLGAAMLLSGLLWKRPSRFRQTAIQIITVLAASGVVILMACMNIITSSGETDWNSKKADYAIVLGAAVRADGNPSRIMCQRLRAALHFMEENPDVLVILSGGQGADEPETEAKCMYDTIVGMGAEESRLLLETQSTTTRENIRNSMEIIAQRGGTENPVALITSEFHQRRAQYIASSLEVDTCAVSAHTDQWFYRVNYTLREVFAFVKAILQGGD